MRLFATVLFLASFGFAAHLYAEDPNAKPEQQLVVDICIYGATPAGINAAIASQREGKSVVIVEPSRWVGGILGAGLSPIQDCSSLDPVGGLTRHQILNLGREEPLEPEGVTYKTLHDQNWKLPPQDIRRGYLEILREHDIRVIYDHRVSRCAKDQGAIVSAFFDLAPFDSLGCPPASAKEEDHLSVEAKVFIDASYEGNLMARADVSYRTGRESREEFGESHAGVTELDLVTFIDPFKEPGNPQSGLLKEVEDYGDKSLGEGDDYTQAYNFRYSTTSDPAHLAPIEAPDNYDAADYELVGRFITHLKADESATANSIRRDLTNIMPMWDLSTNYRRMSLITMAPLGVSRLFADGDYATQAKIWKQHQDYLRGLYHFMTSDPRVPEKFRNNLASQGLNKLHFPDTAGYPHQLYMRCTRKLKGRYTITEHDIYNRGKADSVIGFGLYGVDVYPVRRVFGKEQDNYFVAVEGWMFVGHQSGPTGKPYPIPYEAITPVEDECSNLLVPVCFSGTHIGYSSARMEPVFMTLGESAGIAAVQAINEGSSVQSIDMKAYEKQLLKSGQVLEIPDQVDNMTPAK